MVCTVECEFVWTFTESKYPNPPVAISNVEPDYNKTVVPFFGFHGQMALVSLFFICKMLVCQACKCQYKNLSNHHAQSLCGEKIASANARHEARGESNGNVNYSHARFEHPPSVQPRNESVAVPPPSKQLQSSTSAPLAAVVIRENNECHDTLSVQTPNCIMNHVLDSTMEGPVLYNEEDANVFLSLTTVNQIVRTVPQLAKSVTRTIPQA